MKPSRAIVANDPRSSMTDQSRFLSICILSLLVSFGCGSSDSPQRQAELAERGERLFASCAACHSEGSDALLVGPSLKGVYGRHAGTVPGFRYSQALTSSAVVWDADSIGSLLRDPDGYIPGINMTFTPLADATDVEALIVYLRQLR
jgi:cytochrome c